MWCGGVLCSPAHACTARAVYRTAYPLETAGAIGRFDVMATVRGGGVSGDGGSPVNRARPLLGGTRFSIGPHRIANANGAWGHSLTIGRRRWSAGCSTGQAQALRHGIATALQRYDPDVRGPLKRGAAAHISVQPDRTLPYAAPYLPSTHRTIGNSLPQLVAGVWISVAMLWGQTERVFFSQLAS